MAESLSVVDMLGGAGEMVRIKYLSWPGLFLKLVYASHFLLNPISGFTSPLSRPVRFKHSQGVF